MAGFGQKAPTAPVFSPSLAAFTREQKLCCSCQPVQPLQDIWQLLPGDLRSLSPRWGHCPPLSPWSPHPMPGPGEDPGGPIACVSESQPRGGPGWSHTHHDGQEDVLELVAEPQGVGAEKGKVALQQLQRRQRLGGDRHPRGSRSSSQSGEESGQFTHPSESTRPHPSSLPRAAPAR